ncbi:MAG: hypothetical protein ACP5SB_02595 [Caldisericaceae bacterium]
MRDFDSRFGLGSLLVSLGFAYILRNLWLTNNFFFTFLGIFFLLEGLYYTAKHFISKEKEEATSYLSLLFIGISTLLFTFDLIRPTTPMVFAFIIGSVGLALLLSGAFFKFSERTIFSGVILVALAFVIFLPFALNISDSVYQLMRTYGIGLLLILLGIIVFIPRNRGE